MGLAGAWWWAAAKAGFSAALIGAITLVGRRWGARAAGIVAGLPLTSGPVSVFLALERGADFAADAAVGSLRGIVPSILFLAVYAARCRTGSWPKALGLACLTLVALPALDAAAPGLAVSAALAAAAVAVSAWTLHAPPPARAVRHAPRWELPARMGVAAGLVLAITGTAGLLGADRAGLLSPLPVFGAVLATFTHAHDGADAARALVRATIVSIASFVAFFLAVGLLLPRVAPIEAYLWAGGAALVTSLAAWRLARPRTAG